MSDDYQRAEALFGDRSKYVEGLGVVFPTYNVLMGFALGLVTWVQVLP